MIEGLAREAALTLHTQRLSQAREKAETGRQVQAEQVRLLMDATEEGIHGADVNGACTFVNRAALRLLGYSRPDDLLGRNFHSLVHHTYPDGRPYPKEQCKVRHSTVEGRPSRADDEVHSMRRSPRGIPRAHRHRHRPQRLVQRLERLLPAICRVLTRLSRACLCDNLSRWSAWRC